MFRIKLLIIAGVATAVPLQADDREGLDFFRQRIRPLLVEHCYRCHSERAEKVEANLYLDSRDGVRKGGDQGPAVRPGEPDRSLLLDAVSYGMDDLKMPPDRRLDDEQIRALRKWIEWGAPDPRDQSDAKQP